MNDLSWLLYWAGTLPSLSSAGSFIFFFLTAFALLAFVCNRFAIAEGLEDPKELANYNSTKFSFWALPLFAFLYLSMFFVPDKDTFYAIAVSESGEEILKSPEIGKARKALNNWLDDQLDEKSSDAPAEGN